MKTRKAYELPNNTQLLPDSACTTEMGRTVKLLKLTFKNQRAAQSFYDHLVAILPLRNTEYPKINDSIIHLTNEQYYFYQRDALPKSQELTTEYLGDSFLKTLRADTFDFSYAFILGIIPGEENAKRHQNLRPTSRQPFTMNPEGMVIPRLEKQPMYTPEEKRGFSQIQSCTLIDKKAISPAFGFIRERNSKLYGLMTHIDDALINRLLLRDLGTVSRPFDRASPEVPEFTSAYMLDPLTPLLYHPNKLAQFKSQNIALRPGTQGTNEVLARLRFNPYRSVVTICLDSLEARLLAYDFAQELLEHFTVYAEKHGIGLNPNFTIPILFYIKKFPYESHHNMKLYTTEMRQKDEKEALRIYSDANLRAEHYRSNNYEFLLGLKRLTPELLLERIGTIPLALAMMRNGYVRMLMRLLRSSRQNVADLNYSSLSNLCDAVFDSLLAQRVIERNDPIIAKLILVEAFELADKVIRVTVSDKDALRVDRGELIDHLIVNGNPRHFHYMRLDELLMKAARRDSWVSVRLYLKEYPHQDKTLLSRLFSVACDNNNYEEAVILLRMGVAGVAIENSRSQIENAAESKAWPIVKLFTQCSRGSENAPSYGFALLEALRDKQRELAELLLQVGATTAWRDKKDYGDYPLLSTLLFAVRHGFNELLPQLIEHEESRQDQFSQTRYRLALDLAYVRGNTIAIKLLENITDAATLIDPANIKLGICKLVFEAFSLGERQIGEQRLIRYCHQYQLLPNDNHRVIDGLRAIIAGYSELIITHPSLTEYKILKILVEIVLASNDVFFLKFLRDQEISARTSANIGICPCCYEKMIATPLLASLATDNVRLIKDIVHHHADEKETWQGAIDHAFENALTKEAKPDNVALFVELGADLSRVPYSFSGQSQPIFSTALFHAVSTFNEKLTQTLLNHPSATESIKDQALKLAIEKSRGAMHLPAGALTFDKFLLTHYRFKVTMEHVLLSLENHPACLLLLLGAMDVKHYRNTNYRWDFCYIWAYASFTVNINCVYPHFDPADARKLLINRLEPSMIRHFTLIYLVAAISSAFSAAITGMPYLPNLTHIFNNQKISSIKNDTDNMSTAFDYCIADFKKYSEILAILNDYFVYIDIFPDEAIIISTYHKILAIFDTMKKGLFSNGFFQPINRPDFSSIIYNDMKDVEQQLANKQKVSLNIDVTEEESMPTNPSLYLWQPPEFLFSTL